MVVGKNSLQIGPDRKISNLGRSGDLGRSGQIAFDYTGSGNTWTPEEPTILGDAWASEVPQQFR